MKTAMLAVAAFLAAASFDPASAADPRTIGWEDLLPEERSYHDPFVEMEFEQIMDLSKLYRIEVQGADAASGQAQAEAAGIRERLVSQGLDPDWLFKQRKVIMNQRELADREANPDLIGKAVRLPGYLLPLEIVGQKATEFLLVPSVGACIHVPPPPANQMVFVRYSQGFEVDELYKPVWISGEMRAQSRSQSLDYVDGQAEIETSYAMDAQSVVVYD